MAKYSKGQESDLSCSHDYMPAGLGAVRGFAKFFEDLGDYTPSKAIQIMVDQQKAEFQRLDLPCSGLFGQPLHAADCQGLFCETDKYSR